MQRFLLTLGFLLWFASSALALPSYNTLTGTVLSPDGTACAACKITITTAGTQEVGGATFPGGKARSWTTESDGDLPAGVEAARTLIVKIQIDKGATVTVQIPDTSTADISTLLLEPIDVPSSTNINSLSGTLSVTKGGTGAAPDGDDQVLISTGTTAADWETIPDCDGVTKALNYDVTTNTFTCNSTISATDLACTGCVAAADLASDAVTEAKLKAVDSPTDEECLTYESTGGDFEWQTCGGGGGGSGDIEVVGDCISGSCFTGGADGGNSLQFEGSTADGFETTFTATDPTADRTITLPNATGTVALIYDARDYGVVCDGSTNDTTAIESALAASNTSGAWVQFPRGTCVHSGTINPPSGASEIRVLGGPTTFSYTGSGWGWLIEHDYFQFEDVSLTIGASAKGMMLSDAGHYSTWDRGFLTLSAANPTAFGLVFHSTNGNYHQKFNALSFAGSPLKYNFVGSGYYNSNEVTSLYCGTASPDACVALVPITAADFCVASADPYACCTGAGTGDGTGLCVGDTEGGDGNLFTNVEMNNSASTDYAVMLGAAAKYNTFIDAKCDNGGECINAASTAVGNMFVGGGIQAGGDATTKAVIGAIGGTITSNAPNGLKSAGVAFASLSSDILNGTLIYCTDCQATTTGNGQCTSGGTGALAQRLNGTWMCSDGVSLVGDCSGRDCFSASGTGGTMSFPTTSGAENRVNFYDDTVGFVLDYAAGSSDTYFKFGERSGGSVDPMVTIRNATGVPKLTIHDLGVLQLEDDDSSNYVELVSPATVASNWTLTLPTTDGATNDLLYNTDGAGTLGWRTPNAGTDITADLEEETHASEHSLGGADAVTVTNLASACTNGQVLGGTAGGTGVECQTDDDVPEAADYSNLTAGTGITNSPTGTINATLGTAIDTSEITDATIAQVDVNDTVAASSDPAFGDSSVWFAPTGLVFEGATSNTIEGTLIAADVTASDKTWTLPNETGTICTTGSVCSGYQASGSYQTVGALLDGTNHSDTLAGSVVRGDVIIGNSTPKWARLAKGAANTFLGSDGTDVAFSALTLAGAQFANQGTTTTVLHGNAAGNPSWAKVDVANDTSGNFVATLAGTSNEVTVSGSGSNNAAVTVSLPTAIDIGGKTSFEVPNAAAPTTNVFGQIAGDNNAWAASRGAPQWYDGTANTYLIGALTSDTPGNGQVPKWNTGGTITWEDEAGGTASHAITAASLGLSCDYSVDDVTTLRTALETGGSAAGKAVFLPSGCKVLLGSVGADPIDLASDTSLICEDETAGFALARRRCTGGSLDNVACDADSQCQSGTCSLYDGGASGSFAPTSGTTYTLFRTATGTSGQNIIGCSIWVNQSQGNSTAMGGNGIETGYCTGGTGDGDTCFQTCDTGDATFAGVACNAAGATDCGGGAGSCQNRSQCATGGGSCGSIPYNISRGASGAGSINPIDFSLSTSNLIRDVKIWDHRKGDFSISSGIGTASLIENADTTGLTVATKSATGLSLTSYNSNRFVTYGIKANSSAKVMNSVTHGWDAGIYAGTSTLVAGNVSNGLPGARTNSPAGVYDDTGGLAYTSYKGSMGFMAAGPSALITNNVSGAFICAGAKNGGQHNWYFKDNVCEYNVGPKIMVTGSGVEIETNRLAWSTHDTIIALGDVRGRCSASTRSGLLCLRNMGTDATYGCPGSTCAYSSDFKWGDAALQMDHINIVGNFIHSDQTNVDYIGSAPGKRCQTNADIGKECTSTADCASSAACEFPYVASLNVVGNNMYGATTGDTAIDFSAITAVRSSGTTTPIINANIAANRIHSFPTGVAFASATGLASNVNIEGSFQGTTTPLVNWRNDYGYAFDMKGLLTTDEQGVVVRKTAGGTIARGKFVKQDTSNANRVVVVGFSEGDDVVGVAMEDSSAGNSVKIMTQGYTQCLSDSGSITKGQLLRVTASGDPSSPVAGQVYLSSAASDVVVGVADEDDGAADALFRCIVRQPAVLNSTTSPFTVAYRSSDSSALTSDNTLNDDTQLSVAVSANKNYAIDGVLIVTAASTAPDLAVGLNTPASPTAINAGFVGGDTPAIGTFINSDGGASGSIALPAGTSAVKFGGVLENGANAGNLILMWSQANNNGNAVTVKRGSFIRVQELP